MKQFPPHKIIFKDELDFPNSNAYTKQLAAQIEPSRHTVEGVLYISAEEAHYNTNLVQNKLHKLEDELGLCGDVMEKDRLRIKELEDVIDAVVNRYENVGSVEDFGVSFGIYTICKKVLKK